MHPAYGAGHATVAGGCVTMLKAFFKMFGDDGQELPLFGAGDCTAYEASPTGTHLTQTTASKPLTIQGELDKLAANIAIGRNMAGVHYYSDYFDSLRMGERVAVGILLEQAATYAEPVSVSFTSFDGDALTIEGTPASSHDTCDSTSRVNFVIKDKEGNVVTQEAWWNRHV